MKLLALVLVAACSGTSPSPPATPGSGSPTVGSAARPYAGPPERGPCTDVHGCKLRNNCGCSCDAVTLAALVAVACDESCPNDNICDGYSLICDMSTQTCGAIPKP